MRVGERREDGRERERARERKRVCKPRWTFRECLAADERQLCVVVGLDLFYAAEISEVNSSLWCSEPWVNFGGELVHYFTPGPQGEHPDPWLIRRHADGEALACFTATQTASTVSVAQELSAPL